MPASSTITPGPWSRRAQLDEKTRRNPLGSTALGSRPLRLRLPPPDRPTPVTRGSGTESFATNSPRQKSETEQDGPPDSKAVLRGRPRPTPVRDDGRPAPSTAVPADFAPRQHRRSSSRSCPNHWMGGADAWRGHLRRPPNPRHETMRTIDQEALHHASTRRPSGSSRRSFVTLVEVDERPYKI